jgi:hypothetical protein
MLGESNVLPMTFNCAAMALVSVQAPITDGQAPPAEDVSVSDLFDENNRRTSVLANISDFSFFFNRNCLG